MVRMNHPSPLQVGREFVRQYYSLLNKAPEILHRFYGINSSYVHGSGGYSHGESEEEVIGQTSIHKKILSLNFKECHTKVYQVDAHSTLNNGVVVQVIGELSNNRKPLRRFMQTFVLAPQGDNPYKFYVHNDIFRYEDEVYRDDLPPERQDEEEHVSDPDVDDDPEPSQIPPHCENHMNAQNQMQQIGSKIEQHIDSQAANSDSQPSPSPPSPPTIVNDSQVFEPIQDPTPMEPEGQEDSAFTLVNDTQEPKVDSNAIEPKDDLSGKDESSQVTSWAALASKNTPAQHNFQQGTVVKMNQAHEVGNIDQAQKPAQRPPRSQPPPQRDDPGDAGGDVGGRRGTRYPDNQQIFVGNLPYEITENDLRDHFTEFGDIIDVRINHSHTSNPSFGFVIFEDPKSVEEVLRQMPTTFKNNKRINIEEKKQRGLQRDGRRGPGGWDARRDNNRGGRMQNRGPPRKDWGGPKEGQRPNNYGPRR